MIVYILDMEAKHKEYFFSNHLNRTLVNIHQIVYIHIIEDNHNEVSLELFIGKDVEKINKRVGRFVRHEWIE
jgi:hypothetical protein